MNWAAKVKQSHPELVIFNTVKSFAVVNKTHTYRSFWYSLTGLFIDPSDIGKHFENLP